MDGRMMQDWVTISSSLGLTPVTQGQPFWLDVSAYRDAMAWLDVREVTISGAGVDLLLQFETAPTADEALFATIGGPVVLSAGTITVTQMLGSIAAVPLGKFLRWKVRPSAAPGGTWDVTFRILVAMNRPGYRTPYLYTPATPSKIAQMSPSSEGLEKAVSDQMSQAMLPISIPKNLPKK